jgi:signal transduction histidine kinase
MSSKALTVLEKLARVAAILPSPIYWIGCDGVVLGANQRVIETLEVPELEYYVGRSLFDVYPYEMAKYIKQHDDEVIRTGEILSQEEKIVTPLTKALKYYIAVKAPLRDENNKIIGIIGTSIDITAKKEAEQLRLDNLRIENEIQINLLAEQEKFTQLAAQVAHDIRSPLTALNTTLKHLPEMPEQERVLLRAGAQRINDIANNLLAQHENNGLHLNDQQAELKPWLIVPIVESMLAEKRLQYEKANINIDVQFGDTAHMVFAKVELPTMKRVLSNLINNAIEALPQLQGDIIIGVNVHAKIIEIAIQDNGAGIAPDRLGTLFTAKKTTKNTGAGIGLSYAHDSIAKMEGKISVQSKIGEGSVFTISLPVANAPQWFADELVVEQDKQLIVLDDDDSIHGAWDTRLKVLNLTNPVLHFRKGKDFIDWRVANSSIEILMLSDYELLGEDKTGLDILEQFNLRQNTILITSHYERLDIIERCVEQGITLLPKTLVTHISIRLNSTLTSEFDKPDAVLIDDDSLMITLWRYSAELAGKKLLTFNNIQSFEAQLPQLDNKVPIYIDSNLNGNVRGELYAKDLYEQGFSELYLVTGSNASDFKEMGWLKAVRGKEPIF